MKILALCLILTVGDEQLTAWKNWLTQFGNDKVTVHYEKRVTARHVTKNTVWDVSNTTFDKSEIINIPAIDGRPEKVAASNDDYKFRVTKQPTDKWMLQGLKQITPTDKLKKTILLDGLYLYLDTWFPDAVVLPEFRLISETKDEKGLIHWKYDYDSKKQTRFIGTCSRGPGEITFDPNNYWAIVDAKVAKFDNKQSGPIEIHNVYDGPRIISKTQHWKAVVGEIDDEEITVTSTYKWSTPTVEDKEKNRLSTFGLSEPAKPDNIKRNILYVLVILVALGAIFYFYRRIRN